ncbi:ROK family protein [Arthrobacter sp. CDRTa11]|uniref:ROK family transcriptional regulator n=1 Tax=Arthrobacter sp. CDRTa11 TaxID=2651199 RepID=UPI002265E812|nr:ROK family protein [Arthrobacter sp. CDRTa11]UZX05126.1 ROK family protein [Arthrobacter sp. CDRTa11]
MPKRTSRDIRNESRFALLRGLYSLRTATRQELAAATGLSFATISNIVGELIEVGVLVEAGREDSGGGRPVTRLKISPERGALVGVDVAETYIHVDIYDLALGVIGKAESELAIEENEPAALVRHVAGVIEQAAVDAGITRERLLRAGVSLPGQVDPERGVSVFAPNWDWHEVRIQSLLAEAIGLPVDVDNPLRAIAIAELWFGAGRLVNNVATVNLGTGVGAGLAIDGELVRGASNTAGEWGHTTLVFDGRLCRCGRRGCVEAYLGVPGLQQTMAEINASHDLLTGDRQREFVSNVAKGLSDGDADCLELIEVTGRYFAAALGNLINFINPDHVSVLGWTAGSIGKELLDVTEKHLSQEMLPSAGRAVQVGLSTVAGNSVTLGMATLALESFLEQVGVPSRGRTGPGATRRGAKLPAGAE